MNRSDPGRTASATAAGAEQRREALLAALGRTVRLLRQRQGLSQQALAAQAGLSPRFMSQLEAGAGNISVANLAELARALNVAPARLLLDGESPAAGGPGAAGEPGARPIALVGLRGAGKSTLGPLLAQALGWRYAELDQAIQDATGLATSEIFELHGESYFRQAEREAVQGLLAGGEPVVFSLSGGAVTDAALLDLLKARTVLVWVRATPEQHMQRVLSQGDRRPMADRPNAMAELRRLLEARTPYYQQARLVADTSRLAPQRCVSDLVAQLGRLGVRSAAAPAEASQ